MDTLEDFLQTRDCGDILDIACGGGAFARRLIDGAKSYAGVTGLDLNADSESAFLDNVVGHDVRFVAGSIAAYMNGADRFDTISISNALHHVEDIGDVLRDLRGILRPGGVVIINEMYADGLTPAQETQRDLHAMIAKIHLSMGEHHRPAFTRAEIDAFVAGAGLEVRHAFHASNEDAPVDQTLDGFAARARGVMEEAYPDGAPAALREEYEALKTRVTEIGVGRPPQLILVCGYA